MICKSKCSFSKTFSQIESIQEDFVRLSEYACQLSDIEPSILCQPKAVKRIKDIQRLLLDIENQFFELRSMLDIDGDLDSEMGETDENIFNLISGSSTNKNDAKEQMLTLELTDSILKILTGKGNNQKNPDLISRMIMLRQLIDQSMQKVTMELDHRIG
ncbi:MAG: hypothetical protein HPY59_17770 [Anaerolineae bacterium]|nr:hypothetical protein [Anaerolineae bacterium]